MFRYFVLVLFLSSALVCAQENPVAQEQNHQEQHHQNQQEQRDPTRPLGYSAAGKVTGTKAATLRLSSVLIGAQRKLAIINGHSLREGQSIPGSHGVILASIKPQGVVLQQAGRTWELRLAPSVIKKN